MIFKNQALVCELFEKQVKKRPGRIALSFSHSQISYDALDQESHRIAGLLKQNDIEDGDLVAVDCDSPLERITAILGILKAGGAYWHVHPGYGPQYHRDARNHARVRCVVSTASVKVYKNAGEVTPSKPGQDNGLNHPQAVLFNEWTSPFTTPRGTVLSHCTINHWLTFNIETLRVDFSQTVFISTQALEMAFPLWWANLITGGTVIFHQGEENRDLSPLTRIMKSSGFKSLVCPLHFLHRLILENAHRQVLTSKGTGIKNIITVGEDIFNAGELRRFIKSENIKWHNYYGFPGISLITNLLAETASGESHNYRHVGKPAADTEVFILNPSRQLVSPGIEGELYASGKGVMDQYYQHQELNQRHFFQDTVMPGKKVYKTGYKATWLRDWKIDLQGRTDRLFNIKGCRFHVEEIEALLLRHPQVSDCAVVLRNPGGNRLETKLTAYWVPEGEVNLESIEAFLRNKFPLHLIPIGFIKLYLIPRTSDGHVNREYLEKFPGFDSLDIQSLEREIREQGTVEHVGVLVEEKITKPVPLHLKDLALEFEGGTPGARDTSEIPQEKSDGPGTDIPLAIVHGGELEEDPHSPRTLADLLRKAARENGQHGVIFVQPEGTEYFQSYSSLLEQAQRIAAGLKKIGLTPQDKVIFQLGRNEDYVEAFWGSTLAGVVPVPVAVPRVYDAANHETKALLNIWSMLGNPVILTSQDHQQRLKSLSQPFRLVLIGELKTHQPDNSEYSGRPADPAVILFTSGSTGNPKGVVQCHQTILAREKAAIRFCQLTPRDISINWLPLEHVVGLFMFHIKQVYLGCQQIHAPREYILSNPLRWLDLISKHRATFTFAPNFAYALLNRTFEETGRGNWDLSCMRIVNVGAEPINADNMKKFLALFAPFGLAETAVHPSWGMSETSSGVVYSRVFSLNSHDGIHVLDKHSLGGMIRKSSRQRDTDTVTFVEVGEPFAGVSLRIVDDGNRVLKEGMMGRLQIKGSTITPGYYENPELNRTVFTDDGWFDTGDRAFIYNRRLTITGRTKDVIIINGINYNNNEIEAAVESVQQVALSYTAACAVRDAGSVNEKLAVFFSSLHSDFNRVLEQIKHIQKAVVQKIGIKADYIIPVSKEEIPKTSIGKIQRTKLAQLLESGYFNERVKQIDIGLENENTLPTWFFVREWHQQALPRTGLPTPRETKTNCLLFMDEPGLCETFIKNFAGKNCTYIKVLTGTKFRELDEYCYEINYQEPGDYIHLFERLRQANLPIHDIFHGYGYGGRENSGEDINHENLKNAQYKGVYSLLNIIRGLAPYHPPQVRFLVVTSHAQWVEGSGTFAYEKSGIPGFLKSISQELSWLKCHHVDLEPDSLSDNAAWVFQEWNSAGKNFAVAYRNKRRLVPWLGHVDIKRETRGNIPLKKGGLYLVTGGLGGIGKYVCKWLMEKYQAKLIIVGRTPLPERNRWETHLEEDSVVSKRLKVYLSLESSGRQFTYTPGDICDEDFLQELIRQGESHWNQSLDGVFHLAGQGNWETQRSSVEGEMGLVAFQTPQRFEAMFQTKVYATVVLHRLLRHKPGSLFVAFSSIISLMGAIGYSAYSAANSFLDNFCLYRRHLGYGNTFCLNWSAWDNIGMNEGNPVQVIHAMRSRGYQLISPEQALYSMALALRSSFPQLVIGLAPTNHHTRKFLWEFPFDKQVIKVFYTPQKGMDLSASAVYQALSHHMPAANKPKNVIPELYPIAHMPLKDIENGIIDYEQLKKIDDNSFRTGVEVAQPETREEQVLVGIWKDILALNQIGVEDNFFELGGNSLKSFELAAKVHQAFQVKLPLEEIFKNPTIRELSAYIKGSTGDQYVSLPLVEKRSWYELSSAQQRFYILQQMELQSTSYNVPLVIRLEGTPDKTKVENSFHQLIHRHESLRTSIRWKEGVVVQQVRDHVEFRMEYREETNEVEIRKLVKNFVRPFDLAAAPLLRVGLIRIRENAYIAMIDMHHIISDGVSLKIFVKEFLLLYGGEKLPPLKLRYKDFAHWQNRGKERKRIEKQEAYWLRELAGEIPLLNLPTDYKRPKIQSFEGKTLKFVIDQRETRQLKTIGLQEEATLYMVLVSLFDVLLAKLSGDEDIVIGTPIAGRRHADLQDIIGLFINTLLLRNFPQGDRSFPGLVREVKERTLQAFENQDYQYEDLVEWLCGERDASRNPLFDVMFVLQDQETPGLELYGLKAVPFDHEHNTSKFDLTLQVLESEEQLVFWWEYSTALFKEETIKRFAGYFEKIVAGVLENPGKRISEVELLSPEEKERILFDFSGNRTDYPRTAAITSLFQEQLDKTPHHTAVVFEDRVITYQALGQRAAQLATHLCNKGVKAEKAVGIMANPSLEMIAAIMAILKVGGAYLPINIDYPAARRAYMLKDAGANLLLIDGSDAVRLDGVESIRLDETAPYHNAESNEPIPQYNHIAYIIYTSGTTGVPRGVMVEHRSVIRLVKNTNYIVFRERDRILQTGALEFDASTFEIWGALLNGLGLVLSAKEKLLNLVSLKEIIQGYCISTIWMTSPLFNRMVQADQEIFSGLTNLLVGGDILSPSHINLLRGAYPGLNVINGYGPTENTTFSTTYLIEKEYPENIPIGRPIANSTVYILGPCGYLQPEHVAGEIYVGGDGVSRGYLNNPETTAEKFKSQAYFNKKFFGGSRGAIFQKRPPGCQRLYKTGDLGWWMPDGNIEFIGRMDQQVKIRGYRIELEEIERRLLGSARVKDAVVIAKKGEGGEKYLCGYIVINTRGENDYKESELREYLSKELPAYMIPTYLVPVNRIPLTSNGKVDRKALPEPGFEREGGYTGPTTKTEKRLQEIWSEVLRIELGKIAVDSSFFELGGHSLKATELISRIHQAFDINIPLVEIFATPTIKGLAEYIDRASKEIFTSIAAAEKKEYYPLSSAQKRLYVLQQMDPQNAVYNIPYVVQSDMEIDSNRLEDIFGQLIRRHDSFRTSFTLVEGEPVQRIRQDVRFEIESYIQGPSTRMVKSFMRPFDLSTAPLLRVGMMHQPTPSFPGFPSQEVKPGDKFMLMVDMHHIISDGVSMGILLREFMTLYRGERLTPLRIQYKDYAQWQNREERTEQIKSQEAYWLKEFSNEIPLLNLPLDYSRPAIQSFLGSRVNFHLGEQETAALNQLALEHGVTLYMVLHTTFIIFLSKLSGQEDIVVGTPTANRFHADLQVVIGMFVNTLALRNQVRAETSFKVLLEEVKIKTLEAFENQEYPFDELVEKVAVNRDMSRNPLFDVMFALQNLGKETGDSTSDRLREWEPETGVTHFDLMLSAVEKDKQLVFTMEYCTKLFKEETILRFINYYRRILSLITDSSGQILMGMELMPGEEKRQILYDFNKTRTLYSQDKTIPELFDEQVAKTPDHTAVVYEEEEVTYKELKKQSEYMVFYLDGKGVVEEDVVGIMTERSLVMIIGVLGILKAGGGYLPINAKDPEERKKYILKDSRAKMLVTTSDLGADRKIGRWEGEIGFFSTALSNSPLELERGGTKHRGVSNLAVAISHPPPSANASHLAYIIYTSGSSGEPKGVMVEHRNVVRLVKNTNFIAFSEEYKLLPTGALEFDASTFEIWGTLLNGRRLYLASEDKILTPAILKEILHQYGITTMWMTSPLFNQMVDLDIDIFAPLKSLLVGGDVLSPVHIDRIRKRYPGLNIINGYGPTENTTFSTTYLIKEAFKEKIPIGKPIANSTAYIVDKSNHLIPIGVTGELVVGGDGVARGYLNQPELTAERFIIWSDWSDRSDQSDRSDRAYRTYIKLYKTGDLARWLPGGNIEFLGRCDYQVKVKGYRIELEEVRAHLLNNPQIKEAVVITGDTKGGDKYLCAYIVSHEEIEISFLRESLSTRLPSYMIPSFFMQIEKIPLTSNGKIDKKSLPTPVVSVEKDYTAPRELLERQLVRLWSMVLEIEPSVIGIDSNFFQLGGHSLKALQLTTAVHKELNIKVPFVEIFKAPTIRKLSQYIKTLREDRFIPVTAVEKREYYELSSAQKRLYLLQQLELESTVYNIFQVVIWQGPLDRVKLEETFKALIRRHESLRTSFKIVDEETMQWIQERFDFEIEYFKTGPEPYITGIIKNFIRPFALSQAPLLRVGLLPLLSQEGKPQDKHILVVDMHHIISDGLSHGVLMRDFSALYRGEEMAALRIQYKDFSQWQNRGEQKEAIKSQEAYWLKLFPGKVPLLELPTDYPRPRLQQFEGSTLRFEIEPAETSALKEIALNGGTTLFVVLLALYNIFLSKITDSEDIIVGIPTAGREHADLQHIVGMFVNTLALRNQPGENLTFGEFLEQVNKNSLQAFKNQDYPFEELVRRVAADTGLYRNPLFNVLYTMQNLETHPGNIPGVRLEPYSFENQTAKFDLSLIVLESREKLLCTIEYSTVLFKTETIHRFIGYFQDIVSVVVKSKAIKLREISITHGLKTAQSTVFEKDFQF